MTKQNYQKIIRGILLFCSIGFGLSVHAQTIAPIQVKGKWGYQNVETKKLLVSNLDQALPFTNGIALAQKNGSWGGFNSALQNVIPFKYDKLDYISPYHLNAQKNNNQYILDNDGNKIVNEAFSDAALLSGTTDTFVVADQNGKYGILTSKGNYLIKPKFATPPQTLDIPNLLIFHRKNRNAYHAGAVNLNGDVVVPFEYLFIQTYGIHGLKATRLNGHTSYFDKKGVLIYDNKSKGNVFIDESYVHVTADKEQILYNRSTGVSYNAKQWLKLGKWYYSKNDGDEKTVVITDDGTSFTLTGSVFLNSEHDGYVRVSKKTGKGYLYGLIDNKGNEIHEVDLVDLREWNDRWAVIKEQDQKLYSLFDLTTRQSVLKPEYTNIELYPCGYVKLYKHSDYSFINSDLETIDPTNLINERNLPVYYAWSDRQRSELERKYAYLKPGHSMSDYKSQSEGCDQRFYDFSKIQRISLINDRYGKNPIENRLLFTVFVDDERKVGLLDFNGKIVVPAIYQNIHGNQENGYIPFTASQKLEYRSKPVTGLMDIDGNILLNPIYDKIDRTVEGVAITVVRGLYQLVDIESKKVLLSNYNGIRYNDDEHFILNKHGLSGLADRLGNILIQPIYKELSYKPDNTGMYTAERDGTKFYVDLKGNEYPRSK